MARAALIGLCLLLLLCGPAAAVPCLSNVCSVMGNWCTIASGAFTSPSSWCGGVVPPTVATGNIVISHDLTFSSGSLTTNAMFFEGTPTLTVSGGVIFNNAGIYLSTGFPLSISGQGKIVVLTAGALVNRNGAFISMNFGQLDIQAGGTFNNLQGNIIGVNLDRYACYGGAPTCGQTTWSCCPSGGCNVNNECASCAICGDPHFLGMDGVRYDYMGTPNRVIALISDPIVQVNSLFVHYGDPKRNITVMSNMAFRVCDHSLVLYGNGTALVDGMRVSGFNTSAKTHAVVAVSSALSYQFVSARSVVVRFGMWRASVMLMGAYVNLFGAEHVTRNETRMHGVYGVTGRKDHHLTADKKQCQPALEGGCELPGKWQDYELPEGAPLTSTQWAYTQYDARQCGALVAAAARAQAATDELIAARAAAAKAPLH